MPHILFPKSGAARFTRSAWSRVHAALVFSLVAVGTPMTGARAQSARVSVYHGRGNTAGDTYDLGTGETKSRRPDYGPWTLAKGTEICVDVSNAQPNFYNYTLDVKVDTTKEKMPDVSSLAAALKEVLQANSGAPAPAGTASVLQTSIDAFFVQFSPLADAIDRVQADIKLSDDPDKSVPFAKASVQKNFSGSPTADDLERWAKEAKPVTGSDRKMIAALKAYGETLLNSRSALQKTYGPGAQDRVSKCEKVGDGRTTLRLKIARRGDFGTRDLGDSLITITAEPKYDRKLIEAYPMAFAAMVSNVPTFRLAGGVVQQGSEFSRQFRAGALLGINLPPSGEVAFGPALGVGIVGEKKIALSDLFVGVVASYRDYIRLGVGLGSAEVTTGLKDPALVGQPLGAGAKIEDLLAKGQRNAWYILIGVPGLGLKSPF